MHPQRILNVVQHVLNAVRRPDTSDNTERPRTADSGNISLRRNIIQRATSAGGPQRRKTLNVEEHELINVEKRSASVRKTHRQSLQLTNVEEPPPMGFLHQPAVQQLSFQQSEIVKEYPATLSLLQQSAVPAPQQLSFPQPINAKRQTLQQKLLASIAQMLPPVQHIYSDNTSNIQPRLDNCLYVEGSSTLSPLQEQWNNMDSIANREPQSSSESLEHNQQLQRVEHMINDEKDYPSSSLNAQLPQPNIHLLQRLHRTSGIENSNAQLETKNVHNECIYKNVLRQSKKTPCSKETYARCEIKDYVRYCTECGAKISAIEVSDNTDGILQQNRCRLTLPQYPTPIIRGKKRGVSKNSSRANSEEKSAGNSVTSKYKKIH